jgi:hypothetical protein
MVSGYAIQSEGSYICRLQPSNSLPNAKEAATAAFGQSRSFESAFVEMKMICQGGVRGLHQHPRTHDLAMKERAVTVTK